MISGGAVLAYRAAPSGTFRSISSLREAAQRFSNYSISLSSEQLLMRPSKSARIPLPQVAFLPENQVIIEAALRTI